MAFRFYNTREVALLCNVTIPGVRKWIRQGKLRAKVKPGTPGYYLIADTDLVEFQTQIFVSKYEWRKRLRLKKAARERARATRATTKSTATSTTDGTHEKAEKEKRA